MFNLASRPDGILFDCVCASEGATQVFHTWVSMPRTASCRTPAADANKTTREPGITSKIWCKAVISGSSHGGVFLTAREIVV